MKTDSVRTRQLTWLGLALALMVYPQIANAQWTTSGNDIYKTNTAGNVGIGTNSPAQKLDVIGNILLDSSGNWYGINKSTGEARAVMFNGAVLSDNDYLYFGSLNNGFKFVDSSNSPLVTIQNGGNVGIGTTSPHYRLSLGGSSDKLGFYSDSTHYNNIEFYNSSTGGMVFDQNTAAGGGYTWQFAGAPLVTLQSGGNVGIGTTVPQTALALNSLFASNGQETGLVTGQTSTVTLSGLYNVAEDVNAGRAGLALKTYNAGSYATRVSIMAGGNVGIGTTSPGSKLDVNGVIRNSAANGFSIGNDSGQNRLLTSGTTFQFLTSSNTAAYSQVGGLAITSNYGNTAPSNGLYVEGNVGIGKTNPTAALDVVGSINLTGTVNAKYQDVAEWVPSSEQLSAGTVVVLDSTKSNQVTSSSVSYDTRVAGVVSEQPGIALGEKSDSKVLVATTGRVRVKVDASKGAIHIGDLLVTSDIPGVAMKSEPVEFAGRKMHMPGTLIGKALEPLEKGKGEILVLLSLQ